MAIFDIFRSNSISFTRDEDETNTQTDFNRQYEDFDYNNRFFIPYVQTLEQTDNLWFQFRSDYENIVVTLIDSDDSSTLLSFNSISIYDDYTYYECVIDISSLTGCYKVHITCDKDRYKPVLNFTSNYLNIVESYENAKLIEYYGNDAYADGMIWGERTQELRVESELLDYIGGVESTIMDDSDNNKINVDSRVNFNKMLSIAHIPQFMVEKLVLAIAHDRFFVNGVEYAADETIEIGDRAGDTLMYSPTINLKKIDYENYTGSVDLDGYLPELENKAIRAATGFAIRAENGKAIRAY